MNKKELKNYTDKRSELIGSLMSSLTAKVKANQRITLERMLEKFVEKLETDENGKVRNNAKNRKLLLEIDEVFKDYQKKEAIETIKVILDSVVKIANFNQKFFTAIDGQAKVLPAMTKVKDFMKEWLGIKGDKVDPNGYIDQLVKNDSAKIALKNTAMKIVIGQEGFENAREQIKDLVVGTKGKLGEFEKHQRNFAYDLYSQIDRATADVVRNDLKFQFAIYEGGLIEGSRIFCEEHEGHIYHISEIEKFDPKVGIPPNYNPITDLGGYACRHHLNWISDAMAKALRPDAIYFIEGTAESKGIEPPLNTRAEVAAERKKRFPKD